MTISWLKAWLAAAAVLALASAPPAEAASARPTLPLYVGTWVGQVEQPGRENPFPIVLTISPAAVTTTYPEQSCVGKLARIGQSGTYVFYVEKITKGAYNPATGTGCLDGTITLGKSGDKLMLSWFGAAGGAGYQASATLTRR